MRAYLREDLQEQEGYPPCSEKITQDEWKCLCFKILDCACEDFETEEGFNMLIQHPVTLRTLFVCSIDFNFKH